MALGMLNFTVKKKIWGVKMNKKALTTILILAALSVGGFTYYKSDNFVNNERYLREKIMI